MKTKPNLSIIIIFSIVLILSIISIIGGIIYKEYGIKITLLIVGIVLLIISILEFIGIFSNYEEIINDELIIHILGKTIKCNIKNIKFVEFKGFIIILIKNDDTELCNIDPRKQNILKIIDYLIDNGVEYVEKIQ